LRCANNGAQARVPVPLVRLRDPLFLAAQCNTGPSRLWVTTSACYGAGVRAVWLPFEDEGRPFYFFGFEGDGDFDVVGDFDEGVPLFIP